MKENTLFKILDLIEEIENVDKMIKIHSESESRLMYDQYRNQKFKLSNILFKELIENKNSKPENMYLVKLFIEKFYKNEIQNYKLVKKDSYSEKIEKAFS